ncbi:tpr domain containing protein [Grosmannia clavigera kw1407]|uniref:Tpr domain containing protein n=1 Tax=Grosmannia clavigera (strain kw1407 / UAMH 11150) TaxID=655863 RepID=F0XC95_GROCL|nr:tpr domain containing protein [Grosmannia clavigera kw1407]EFX04372.1 tpr domain containing protein [Grosmannia clavigera kw1407]
MNATVAAMTQGDVDSALTSARAAYAVIASAGSEDDDNSTNTTVDGIGKAAVCALLGEILLENGDVEVARQVLTVAANLDTDGTLSDALGGGPDKYFYLAQLSENGGRESVSWFERGAAALRSRLQQAGGEADEKSEEGEKTAVEETRDKLAQVLCAVAEVWMTDLSFEPDCEAQCEALVTEASLLAPTSPDVWQTLASVRVSQERLPDARAAVQRSLDLWADLPPDHPAVPLFSVRVGLVRLLLTVDWAEKAAHIATTRLLREDDEAVEVWYLAGYAHYLQGQKLREGGEDGESEEKAKGKIREDGEEKMADQDDDSSDHHWQDYWRDARRCLGRCLKEFKRQSYEDERLGQHAKELLDDVVAVLGPAPEGEDEEDEGEWVDENDGADDDSEDDDGDEDME